MLPDGCADWVCMGDAFHWTDRDKALPDIRRILKTGGHFTAIWSLRDLENDPLQRQVDHMIRDLVPGIRRVYEDVEQLFEELPRVLSDEDGFTDCIEVTGRHREPTPPERYLGMWGLSYDVQSQAGPAVWPHILDSIEALVRNKDVLTLQYVTRSWSATAA